MDADVPDQDTDTASTSKEAVTSDRAGAFARLFDGVREGAYIGTLNPDGAQTLAANPYLRRIFGFPPETPDFDIDPFAFDRFADPQAGTAFLQQLKRDGHIADHQLRMRRLDGTIAWIEVTCRSAPLTHDPGSFEIVALVRDVSERKRMEDRSRDLYHQLQQAEKLAALGQTISGVAHELNNPLATILSWAERLAERPADDKTRRGLEVIRSESERAARIVRNLLTFARKRQTTRLMVDLNEVVRETLALRAYEQRTSNIRVTSALAPSLPAVFADSHQIKQVILNLVINAEQAMLATNNRGSLTIRTSHDLERDSVVLEVEDDGPGIGEEVQAKIFDPFYTTKEVGKGTGLGLSVAYAIVQEHGGRIWVKSTRGAGATFFVELPVGGQPLGLPKPSAEAVSLDRFKGLRVLVADDDQAIRQLMSTIVKREGLEVDIAADGAEAIRLLGERDYAVILVDLMMPRIDGFGVIEHLRTHPSDLKPVVLVISAYADQKFKEVDPNVVSGVIRKPFEVADVGNIVRLCVTGYEELTRSAGRDQEPHGTLHPEKFERSH